MSKTIAQKDLIRLIGECELFLQEFAAEMDWSNAETLEQSILTVASEIQEKIREAHHAGVINADWMKASRVWTGFDDLTLEVKPTSEKENSFTIKLLGKHQSGHGSAGATYSDEQNFSPTESFAAAVTFIKDSAVKMLAHSQYADVDRTAHYDDVSDDDRHSWAPATLEQHFRV